MPPRPGANAPDVHMSATAGWRELNILHARNRKIMLAPLGLKSLGPKRNSDAGDNPNSRFRWQSSIVSDGPGYIGGRMDIERTMQFILDQQAQFSSDIARINSVLLGAAERQRKFEQKYPGVGKNLATHSNHSGTDE